MKLTSALLALVLSSFAALASAAPVDPQEPLTFDVIVDGKPAWSGQVSSEKRTVGSPAAKVKRGEMLRL